jgi:hypothetical protein
MFVDSFRTAGSGWNSTQFDPDTAAAAAAAARKLSTDLYNI